MNNITYHRANQNDIQTLVDARVEFLTEYWGRQNPAVENKLKTELKKYFEKAIPAQTYICWMATVDNKMVGIGGMAVLQKPGSFRVPEGLVGYIMNMYTVPKHRKKGIATLLLQKLTDTGRQMGINFFELHATKEGEPIYLKNGFEVNGEPTLRKFI